MPAHSQFLAWPADITECIASRLPANEAACNLRLVNKSAAAALKGTAYAMVDAKRAVPAHAVAARWCNPAAIRTRTLKQRRRLLALGASSGCIPTMDALLQLAGCELTPQELAAAAAAGELAMCRWLAEERGCPWDESAMLEAAGGTGSLEVITYLRDSGCIFQRGSDRGPIAAAAAAGHRPACELLLQLGAHPMGYEPGAAARGGHVGLLEWLLGRRPEDEPWKEVLTISALLEGVAEGCDLPTMQRVYALVLDGQLQQQPKGRRRAKRCAAPTAPTAPSEPINDDCKERVLGLATASGTHDWKEKALWLLRERKYPPTFRAADRVVAACTDDQALPRLEFLRQQGAVYEGAPALSATAAAAGKTRSLAYLLEQGVLVNDRVYYHAARCGHVDTLRMLHARGVPLPSSPRDALAEATRNGHLPAVRWLLGALNPSLLAPHTPLAEAVVVEAARAERHTLQLLQLYVDERGCPLSAKAFLAAAKAGNAAVLEWLAARGCPVGSDGGPYLEAGRNGDLATLRTLRQLGVPFGHASGQQQRPRAGETFVAAVFDERCSSFSCPLAVLRWLLEEGCCPEDGAQGGVGGEAGGEGGGGEAGCAPGGWGAAVKAARARVAQREEQVEWRRLLERFPGERHPLREMDEEVLEWVLERAQQAQ